MKIKRLKGRIAFEPRTSNDCYNCGLIATQMQGYVKVEVADYGIKSVSVQDKGVVQALCGDMAALPMSKV